MGVIKIFDGSTNILRGKLYNIELEKPLNDARLDKNKVTTIFLTEDGKYCLSGYKKGILALWNMAT